MNKKLLKRILSLLMALIMFINISCFYSLKPREVKAMGGTVVVTGSAITLATALKVVCGAVAVCGALVGAEALVNNADDIKHGINKLQNDIKDSSTEIYQNVKATYTETAEKIKNNIGYISAKYGANATNDLLDDSSWWEIPGDVELGDDLIINIPWGETETEDVIQSWEKNLPDEYFQDPEAYAKKFFEQYNQESEENKDKLGGGGNNGNNFKNSKFWKKIKGYLTMGALVGGSSATIGSMLGHYFADYEQLESEKSALSEADYNSRYNSLVDSINNDESLKDVKDNIKSTTDKAKLFEQNYFVTSSSNDVNLNGFSISAKNQLRGHILYQSKSASYFDTDLGEFDVTLNNAFFVHTDYGTTIPQNVTPRIACYDPNATQLLLKKVGSKTTYYVYFGAFAEQEGYYPRTYNGKEFYSIQPIFPYKGNIDNVPIDGYLTFIMPKLTKEEVNSLTPFTLPSNAEISNNRELYLPYIALYGDTFTKKPDGNLVIKGYANTLTKKDNIKNISKEVDNNIATNFKITDTLSTVTPEQTRDIAVTDKLIETALRVQQNFPEDTKPTPEQLNQIAFEEVQKTFDDIINDVKDPITTPDYEDIIDGTFTPETTDPTLPTNPSTPDVPDVPEDINFNGINGIDLKKFFPFCIPFDLYNFLVWLNKEPETPIIELPIVIDMLHINFVLTLDLSDYEALSNILRTFLAVIYTVALMLKTRDIIRG